MKILIILIYSCWALYSGFKVISGRIAWLDQKKPVNMIVKCILSLVIGYFIAAFYLIYLVFKLITSFWKNW